MSKGKKKVAEQQQMNNDYAMFQQGLDGLSGTEIFEIFTNQQSFLELWNISGNFPNTMIRFCWRLKYIIGQTFLQIQKQLSAGSLLDNSLLLDSSDIHQLGNSILQKAKMMNQSKDFQGFKKELQKTFNKGNCDQDTLLNVYGYCMKIWKPPIVFQMDLSLSNPNSKKNMVDQSIKKPQISLNKELNSSIKAGTYAVSRMPQNIKSQIHSRKMQQHIDRGVTDIKSHKNIQENRQFKIQKSQDVANKTNNNRIILNGNQQNGQIRKTSSLVESGDQIINLNDGKQDEGLSKPINRNWKLVQQEFFCKMYIECDTHEAVKSQLEKKYGVDARWSSVVQIRKKIQHLTSKVFKKFENLDTINVNIKRFVTLKSSVMYSERVNEKDRAALYKIFAAIYEAMLNVDQKKKKIISTKVIQVINICQKAQASAC